MSGAGRGAGKGRTGLGLPAQEPVLVAHRSGLHRCDARLHGRRAALVLGQPALAAAAAIILVAVVQLRGASLCAGR